MKLSNVGRAIAILVVEDNPADRRMIIEGLRDVAVPTKLTCAADGATALDMITGARTGTDPLPDMILLDISLPRVHGTEVLAQIKSDPATRRIPVIVLTGSAEPVDIRQTLDLGANGYVRKPHDLEGFRELAQTIEAFWFTTAEMPSY